MGLFQVLIMVLFLTPTTFQGGFLAAIFCCIEKRESLFLLLEGVLKFHWMKSFFKLTTKRYVRWYVWKYVFRVLSRKFRLIAIIADQSSDNKHLKKETKFLYSQLYANWTNRHEIALLMHANSVNASLEACVMLCLMVAYSKLMQLPQLFRMFKFICENKPSCFRIFFEENLKLYIFLAPQTNLLNILFLRLIV